MAYEDYNIIQYEKARFKGDRSVMTDEIFKQVHDEYINTTGAYDADEFDRISYIEFLLGRVNYIKLFIKLQKQFLDEFDIPCHTKFKNLSDKYGYFLLWNDDKKAFLSKLDWIESNEKKYQSKLNTKLKELKEFRETKAKLNPQVEMDDDKRLKKEQENFRITINVLGKIGYKIDDEKTSVQSLALMIKGQQEDNQKVANRY